jgi:hypothetical protein
LEEAQGIARSTLFGPIVRKEAVMAMLILSVWSQGSCPKRREEHV